MIADKDPQLIFRRVLPNGVTVLVDSAPHFRSAAIAVSLLGGTRDEHAETNGITHLLEHLLFKKTTKRDRFQLNAFIDEVGGEVNAVTDADNFTLFGVVPKEAVFEALDFFCELLLDAAFDQADLEIEKEIIRQEIRDGEEHPGDLAYRIFREEHWRGSTLAWPIVGTEESLATITLDQVRSRLSELLTGSRIVVSVCGDIEPQRIVEVTESRIAKLKSGDRPRFSPAPAHGGFFVQPRTANQTYLLYGCKAPSLLEQDYLPFRVFVSALGQGSSSRLFMTIREQLGLSYDISSAIEAYADAGVLIINAACERSNLKTIDREIQRILKEIVQSGISPEEFARNKRSFLAQLADLEDSPSLRAFRSLETELLYGSPLDIETVRNKVNAVTYDEVNSSALRILRASDPIVVLAGDVEESVEGKDGFSTLLSALA